MKFVHGLMAGHGGMVNGKYATAPSKMFTFEDGLTIFEGVENRKIKDTILKVADWYPELEVVDVVPENEDIPLSVRTQRANNLFKEYKKQGKMFILWELHNNAGKGTGYEIFSTSKKNFSDKMATCWINAMNEVSPKEKNRGHKEKDYYIIKNLNCFGVLIEFFFFDNRVDVDRETTPKGIADNALSVIRAMQEVQKLTI